MASILQMGSLLNTVGVIGAGSFGTALANLLAHNTDVLLYSRNPELVNQINQTHSNLGVTLPSRIQATGSLQEIGERCTVIFPVVPSENFREMIRKLNPFLRPYHILIHGTKGFDVSRKEYDLPDGPLSRQHVRTMSEVIREESVVVRVGCLSGPNLASEILEGQPTATVVASRFEEVIAIGRALLQSRYFQVYGSLELLGSELAGALKNTIALGSGILSGQGLGKNIQAVLITRGLMEMIQFGEVMGADSKVFYGAAGIGDLICTATSTKSRNFSFGKRLGQGEKTADIAQSMPELAEGVRTVEIAKQLADFYHLDAPITRMLYDIIYHEADIHQAIESFIQFPEDINL